MAKIFVPDPARITALGFEAVAHVPVIFDGRNVYCREHNRYLRERALGEWSPKHQLFCDVEPLAPKSVRNSGNYLCVFVTWCDENAVDWLTVTYKKGPLNFQKNMTDGIWSPSGRNLGANTANQRADEATNFLIWAAQSGLRAEFTVPYRSSTRRIATDDLSSSGVATYRTRVGRAKSSLTSSVATAAILPKAAEIGEWLQDVKARLGLAKYLACRFPLETGARLEETVALNEHQIPTKEELKQLASVGHTTAAVNLIVTKGMRPRTIAVSIQYLLDLRRWLDGKWLRSRFLFTKRTGLRPSNRVFLSDSRDHEGTPISPQTLYRCFKLRPHPIKWHPHFARHAFACFSILYTLEKEAQGAGRSLTEMGADWILGRGGWCLKTLSHQLGHLSKSTTDLYLRWLVTAAGVAEISAGWHAFLAGENVEGAE
ncbi:Site-specific recombinase XerD [Mesorhizobium albiziae]|uniref:Site-specific recombinase XerD n=1 Tax=Neomesorhizobium albiziae TaxID=335020 RepID=A0A1I4F4Y0_9HYPH|nr:site-specific integrase [Mesorhizobium albiziae]SFL13042.1 Site-specific recombinase XerD [Mesorhizobium albiziae]